MIVTPKVKGFICTTAHPAGCAENVRRDAEYAAAHPNPGGPKRVLVIGASTGYGLACRVAAAFGSGAKTVGISLEREPGGKRTGTAGWYNTLAFDALAAERGIPSQSINADAFSEEGKAQTLNAVEEILGQADLVIYSLAAPKRTEPSTGITWSSAIRPIGEGFRSKTLNFHTGEVTDVEIAPASGEEITGTVKVMGGDDWLAWMERLHQRNLLAPGCATLAFSYIGPTLTHPIYKDGTIGRAKLDLEEKARQITGLLAPRNGRAFVSVNKALVTQASSAIPVVPLYMSILLRVMKDAGSHEDCIHQMVRMMERIYSSKALTDVPTDEEGRIRMDDWEMEDAIQQEVLRRWQEINTGNTESLADVAGYREDFFSLFGFGLTGINYEQDVEI